MVAAMLLGPILAVQIQKFLEARRELRRTRMNLFLHAAADARESPGPRARTSAELD
jgi:hypothetical protein